MLTHLTEELAVELGPGIRVNGGRSGGGEDEVRRGAVRRARGRVAAAYPLKRLGEPDDIGSVVAFLLSAGAGWVTGQTLVLDGGVSLTGGA